MNFFKIFSFIHYYFVARHYKGHAVHSPFAFEFITKVVYASYPYYAFRQLFSLRKKTITKQDHSSWKLDKLIFRTLQFWQPKAAIVADCNHLFSPFLFASVSKQMRVYAVDRNECSLESFSSFFGREIMGNIHSIESIDASVIEKLLNGEHKIDFLLFDLHHEPQKAVELITYFEELNRSEFMVIVKNPYSSKQSAQCWKNLLNHQTSKVSMDLFEAGFLFFKPELQNQHYVVRF